MLEYLRIALGLVLIVFLPGIALVYAIFPRKGDLDLEYDGLYRIFLGIGFSVVIVILVGFVLNSFGLKDDGTGYFTEMNIIISLLLITLISAIIAWFRGAFPGLGSIHSSLYREPERGIYEMGGGEPFIDRSEKETIVELTGRRNTLNRRLVRLDRRPGSKTTEEERNEILSELRTINDTLDELETKRRGGV